MAARRREVPVRVFRPPLLGSTREERERRGTTGGRAKEQRVHGCRFMGNLPLSSRVN